MKRIAIWMVFLVLVGSFTTKAQTGAIKGNYCGHEAGGPTWPASVGFMVGSEKWVFDFESKDGSVKRVRFSLATVKVGAEFSISYLVRRGIPYITSIAATGRKKRVFACSV